MKTLLRGVMRWSCAFLLSAATALAQDRAPFRQPELDQMLAPIARYPDALLSQMLMAATYPLEVVQAARWSRARPGLAGQAAVEAAGSMDGEPSVRSLTAFPQVLAVMDEKLEWTERLGEAFLIQPEDVMSTIQALRRRPETARAVPQRRLAPSESGPVSRRAASARESTPRVENARQGGNRVAHFRGDTRQPARTAGNTTAGRDAARPASPAPTPAQNLR